MWGEEGFGGLGKAVREARDPRGEGGMKPVGKAEGQKFWGKWLR